MPPPHDTFVLGDVTWNGPEVFVTVTLMFVNCVSPIVEPGTYGLLSLTVNLKFSVLATELSASMLHTASPPGSGGVTARPARMVDSLGNVRVGEAVGLKDNQFGPVNLVGDATLFDPDVVALSFCSQQ